MRRPFMFRGTATYSNGGYRYIDLPPIQPGQVLLLREVEIYNGGNATFGSTDLVLNRNGEAWAIAGFPNAPGAGHGGQQSFYMWFHEGDYVTFRYTDSSTSGFVAVQFSGWLCDQEDVEILIAAPAPAP